MLLVYFYIVGMIFSSLLIFETCQHKGLRDKLLLTLFYPIVIIPLILIILIIFSIGIFKNFSMDASINYFFHKVEGTSFARMLENWAKLTGCYIDE
jgi:hypothetical protein